MALLIRLLILGWFRCKKNAPFFRERLLLVVQHIFLSAEASILHKTEGVFLILLVKRKLEHFFPSISS